MHTLSQRGKSHCLISNMNFLRKVLKVEIENIELSMTANCFRGCVLSRNENLVQRVEQYQREKSEKRRTLSDNIGSQNDSYIWIFILFM
jgi:hypothetical protein